MSGTPAAPPRQTSIGFAPDVEKTSGNTRGALASVNESGDHEGAPLRTTTSYGGPGDRALLRTETGRISIAGSTHSNSGPRLERTSTLNLQRIEARTALPIDFRTLSINVSETKEGRVDPKGAVKGVYMAVPNYMLYHIVFAQS